LGKKRAAFRPPRLHRTVPDISLYKVSAKRSKNGTAYDIGADGFRLFLRSRKRSERGEAAYCSNIFSDRVTKRMQGEIAKSNEMAAKSNEIAATANERAEELKAGNLKLGITLEEEKLARLEIQRQLAPRFLSPKEQKIIAEVIQPYAGHDIKVAGIGDPESELYADQFARLLDKSKWKVEKIHGALLGPPQYGIFLVTSEKPDQAVQALISALKKAGIKFKPQIDRRFTAESLTLRVGDKDPTDTLSKPTP
jgi:hypothetical protein